MRNIGEEFLRYVVVGGIAFCADFSAFAGLTSLAGVHYLVATLLSFLLGTWVNYRLSVRWVFAYRAVSVRQIEFTVFLLVGAINLALSVALMALLVAKLAMHVLLAKLCVTAFTLVANFSGRRALLFTRWRQAAKP